LELLNPVFRYAVEFRNLSWIRDETWELLKKYNVAYVNVDEPVLPPDMHLTAEFGLFPLARKGRKNLVRLPL
jgi:uncharacterized protein YecE (DUF72 family)